MYIPPKMFIFLLLSNDLVRRQSKRTNLVGSFKYYEVIRSRKGEEYYEVIRSRKGEEYYETKK